MGLFDCGRSTKGCPIKKGRIIREGKSVLFSDYIISNKDLKACIRQIAFSPCGRIMLAVGDHARVSRYDFDEHFVSKEEDSDD